MHDVLGSYDTPGSANPEGRIDRFPVFQPSVLFSRDLQQELLDHLDAVGITRREELFTALCQKVSRSAANSGLGRFLDGKVLARGQNGKPSATFLLIAGICKFPDDKVQQFARQNSAILAPPPISDPAFDNAPLFAMFPGLKQACDAQGIIRPDFRKKFGKLVARRLLEGKLFDRHGTPRAHAVELAAWLGLSPTDAYPSYAAALEQRETLREARKQKEREQQKAWHRQENGKKTARQIGNERKNIMSRARIAREEAAMQELLEANYAHNDTAHPHRHNDLAISAYFSFLQNEAVKSAEMSLAIDGLLRESNQTTTAAFEWLDNAETYFRQKKQEAEQEKARQALGQIIRDMELSVTLAETGIAAIEAWKSESQSIFSRALKDQARLLRQEKERRQRERNLFLLRDRQSELAAMEKQNARNLNDLNATREAWERHVADTSAAMRTIAAQIRQCAADEKNKERLKVLRADMKHEAARAASDIRAIESLKTQVINVEDQAVHRHACIAKQFKDMSFQDQDGPIYRDLSHAFPALIAAAENRHGVSGLNGLIGLIPEAYRDNPTDLRAKLAEMAATGRAYDPATGRPKVMTSLLLIAFKASADPAALFPEYEEANRIAQALTNCAQAFAGLVKEYSSNIARSRIRHTETTAFGYSLARKLHISNLKKYAPMIGTCQQLFAGYVSPALNGIPTPEAQLLIWLLKVPIDKVRQAIPDLTPDWQPSAPPPAQAKRSTSKSAFSLSNATA